MSLRRGLARLLSSVTAGPSAPPAPFAVVAAAWRSVTARHASISAAAPDDESLDEVRARIFGTAIGDGRPSGRKLLRKRLAGPAVSAWYPPEIVDPLFVDVDDIR